VPLARPGIATVALFKFVGSWNAFLWVLIMTDKVELRTVPVGLRYFMSDMGTERRARGSTSILHPHVLLSYGRSVNQRRRLR